MIEILPESHDNILGVRATGKLTDEDYQKVLIPALEEVVKKYGKSRLLCYMDDNFQGLEIKAMWDDAKFFFPHQDDFDKMAIVGGKKWIELLMKLFARLMQGETRIFPGARLQEAWDWINS